MVVDGSPNSFDESLLRTTRERVIDIKPMTKEMIMQIDQLQDLFRFSKEEAAFWMRDSIQMPTTLEECREGSEKRQKSASRNRVSFV